MRPVTADDSVLIVAPHPDDESLCCGGLIHMARKSGARVAIVWITNGDGSRWDAMLTHHALFPGAGSYQALALTRMEEARAAARSLDVSADSTYFLGYPDRGVRQLMGAFYESATPWRSRYTRASSVIYPDAFDPGAPYEGERLAKDFRAILDRVKPTLVLAPSPRDSHPDHHGVALLATRVLAERGELGELRYWIVHGGTGWPAGGYQPRAPQTISPRGLGLHWEELPLDEEAVAAKLQAIAAHQSQMRMMGHTMRRYVRSTELYAPAR
jgi:LmbE family N-acetylglucosaminyl deacetylase